MLKRIDKYRMFGIRLRPAAPTRRLSIFAAFFLLTLSGCMAGWTEQMRVTQRMRWFACDEAGRERIAYVPLGDSFEFREHPLVRPHPTLIFVHGLGGSKYFWKDFAALMVHQHEYPVVLVDLLGHGDSDKPTNADYRSAAQGRRLARFIRENRGLLGERVVFVGLSYGANSSLEAALEFAHTPQDATSTRIAGVFSISAPAFYYPALEEAPHALEHLQHTSLSARLALAWVSPEFFENKLIEGAMWHPERISAADRAEVRRVYSNGQTRAILVAATRDLILELRDRKDRFDYFSDVRCPVVVMGGAQDSVVPNWVQTKLAESVGGAPLILDECGHAVPYHQPSAFLRALLGFLNQIDRQVEVAK